MSQDLAATSGVTEVEERSPSLLSRLLAETFGTFLLTLVTAGGRHRVHELVAFRGHPCSLPLRDALLSRV